MKATPEEGGPRFARVPHHEPQCLDLKEGQSLQRDKKLGSRTGKERRSTTVRDVAPRPGSRAQGPRRALHAAAGLADADGRERAMLSRLPTTYAGTLCSRREGWHSDPLRSRGGP